ncbi:hypothetical protein NP233_g5595 [Leucocoprinus birnbaumii]|uniref:Uncharacterized protein n=1 Tax=Leucocoprinus birnbaumii TaxID=56174 RepID=A0AAD5VUW6_9AGAR|nr:hypothetical protein NP233_g5595 [Leucocoprinus birnbaumii]
MSDTSTPALPLQVLVGIIRNYEANYIAVLTLFAYDSVLLLSEEVCLRSNLDDHGTMECPYNNVCSLEAEWFCVLPAWMRSISRERYAEIEFQYPLLALKLILEFTQRLGFYPESLSSTVAYNIIVIVLLYAINAAEITAALVAFIASGILSDALSRNSPPDLPSIGCWYANPTSEPMLLITYFVIRSSRVFTTSVELALMMIKFYLAISRVATTKTSEVSPGYRVKRILTPMLWVFYRDGILFFVPVFAIQILGFSVTLAWNRNIWVDNLPWGAWLAVTYYICADCSISDTTLSEKISTLQFHEFPPSEHVTPERTPSDERSIEQK